MSFRFLCCGLQISSDIRLPELTSADTRSKIDVIVRKRSLPKQGLLNPKFSTTGLQASSGELWLAIPEIARFRISGGTLIEYDPDRCVDEQSLRLFLLGSCLGTLLHQRGLLVLHGNAIRVGDTCVIFAGASGCGKSSLAALSHQLGFDVLADDICAIDSNGFVQPSYPQLKIWQDTAEQLNINVTKLNLIHYQKAKYAYRLESGFCETPLPVSSICFLSSWSKNKVGIEPLHGASKFMPIRANTYRLDFLEAMGLTSGHFKACSDLASNTSVSDIHRPKMGFHASEIIDLICSHIPAGSTLGLTPE